MKRVFSIFFTMAMMVAFVMPATASQSDSTPDASTPQASPSAESLQQGVTEYSKVDDDDNEEEHLTIDLTLLEDDMDGIALMESYDPEDDAGDTFSLVEEHDAAENCRLIEYTSEGDEQIFIGICANDEFGLWIIGTEVDAVKHVSEQFSSGETDLVPEDYEESDID